MKRTITACAQRVTAQNENKKEGNALSILEESYARGEISKEEFEEEKTAFIR